MKNSIYITNLLAVIWAIILLPNNQIFALQTQSGGVVFTISSTDHTTGESLGNTEILVEGTLLKMTFLDSGNQKVEVAVSANDEEILLSGQATSQLSASSVASESVNNIDNDLIYRADRREMVVVDHQHQEFYVIDETFLETIKGNFSNAGNLEGMNDRIQQAYELALAQLDAQDLTPEERTAAEQMLKNTLGMANTPMTSNSGVLDIVKAGDVRFKNYPATKYQVQRAGKTLRELTITDWSRLGAGARAQETIESFFDFMAEISGAGPLGQGSGEAFNFFESMDQINGFPVRGKSFKNGVVDEEFSLESITERDLDPDAYEPPKGYRLRTMPGGY